MRFQIPVIFAIVLCMTFAVPSEAQVPPQDAPTTQQGSPTASQFIHEYYRPGRSTHAVFMVGDVGNRGIWRVEPQIDLVELLSAARIGGVGQVGPERARTTTIRIYRNSPQGRELHFEATFDQLMRERATYPTLEANDVIEVETRDRRTISWRDISSIVGTASSITVLFFRIFDL